jgi:hypothetical protein
MKTWAKHDASKKQALLAAGFLLGLKMGVIKSSKTSGDFHQTTQKTELFTLTEVSRGFLQSPHINIRIVT